MASPDDPLDETQPRNEHEAFPPTKSFAGPMPPPEAEAATGAQVPKPSLLANGRPFEARDELARGGMGVVLHGYDHSIGRDVAIKVMRPEMTRRPEALARFLEEAQIGGQLQHPGIVPIYEMGHDSEQRPFFVMKLIKGRNFGELLAKRKEPLDNLARHLSIFLSICHTMAYAHEHGVIHRDLKPGNVMLGSFGEVYVVDWGLAKVVDAPVPPPPKGTPPHPFQLITNIRPLRSLEGEESSHSRAGSVMGTLGYMPPEQALGELDSMDRRSDVFALGSILCEILTGDPAYRRCDKKEMLQQAKEANLDDALERLGCCGEADDLTELVRECLSPVRSDRPDSATVLVQRVQEHLASREERTRQALLEAAEERAKAEAERRARRMTIALSALAVVLVILGVLAATMSADQARQQSMTDALEEFELAVQGATEDADAIDAERSLGNYESGLSLVRSFEATHANALMAVTESRLVAELRPDLIDRARTLWGGLDAARQRLYRDWLDATLQSAIEELPEDLAQTTQETEDALAAGFERFREALRIPGNQDLPLAEFALWRARIAAARARAPEAELSRLGEHRTELARQVALAWATQPEAQATARCLLLLAEHDLERIRSVQDVRRLVLQSHDALEISAAHESLRADALLALGRSLVLLSAQSLTPLDEHLPHAERVPAHELALRCALAIVTPGGELRTEARQWLSGRPADELEELRREAADIVAIARHSVGGVSGTYRPSPLRAGSLYRHRAAVGIEVYDFALPPSPSLEPPTLTLVETLPRAALLERFGLPGATPGHTVTLHPNGLVSMEVDGARGTALHVLDWNDPARPQWSRQLEGKGGLEGFADLNGDERPDLVLNRREQRVVEVCLGNDAGSFDSPLVFELVPPPGRVGSRCIVDRVTAHDLNGDGRDELIIGRRGWAQFRIEVWRLDDEGNPGLAATAHVGETSPIVARFGAGLRIVASPRVQDAARINFDAAGAPLREGLHAFAIGRGLEPLELSWDTSPYDVRRPTPMRAPLTLRDGTHVLMDEIRRGDVRLSRWHFFEGDLAEPRSTRVRYAASTTQEVAGFPLLFQTGSTLCRRLTEADLGLLVDRPIPAPPKRRDSRPSALRVAELLLFYRHPEAALEVLRQADLERTLLLPLEIRALRDAGAGRELIDTLDGLSPADRDIAALLDGIEFALEQSGSVERVAPILERWAKATTLIAPERQRVTQLHGLVQADLRELGRSKIRASGLTGQNAQGNDFSVAESWWSVAPGRTQMVEGEPWHIVTEAAGYLQPGRTDFAFVAPSPDGATQRLEGPSGLLVRRGPGSWRATIEYETRFLSPSSVVAAGLHPLSDAHQSDWWNVRWPRVPTTFMSKANIYFLRVHRCIERGDLLVGRRLRLELSYFDRTRVQRVTLTDVESGDIVGAYTIRRHAPPTRDLEVLGLTSWGGGVYSDVRVHEIRAWGALSLVGPGDAAWRDLARERPFAHEIVEAERLRLGGTPTAAAERIDALVADLVEQVEGDEATSPLRPLVARLRIEAAWLRSDSQGSRDAAKFVAELDELSVNLQDLLTWLLARGDTRDTRAAWRAVGELLQKLEVTPEQIQSSGARVLVDIALGVASDDTPPAALARRFGASGLGNTALGAWLSELLDELAAAGELDEDLRQLRVQSLFTRLRRAEGLLEARSEDGEALYPTRPHYVELQRLLQPMRERELEGQKASLHRAGFGE